MFQSLLQLDQSLFLFLNHLPHNFIINSFFALLSGVGKWIIWLILAALIFIWEEKKDKKIILQLIIAVLLTLLIVDVGLKNLIQRPRPELVLKETIFISDQSQSPSFPSGHATIAFAAAYILSRNHKKWIFGYWLLAILISFSRIYLGKHYPSDVLAGAVIGFLIGMLSQRLIKLYQK